MPMSFGGAWSPYLYPLECNMSCVVCHDILRLRVQATQYQSQQQQRAAAAAALEYSRQRGIYRGETISWCVAARVNNGWFVLARFVGLAVPFQLVFLSIYQLVPFQNLWFGAGHVRCQTTS